MSNYELSTIDKDIIRLWEQGFSGSHIAKELYVTRNVVMGRIHRMRKGGITVDSRTIDQPVRVPPKKNYRKPYPAPKPEPVEASPKQGVRFLDLQFGGCKYVMNDGNPSSYIFCGLPAADKSYCKEHHKICYLPKEPKRKRHHSYHQPATTMGKKFYDDPT